MQQTTHSGFYRITHVIGNASQGIAPIIPVSRATWYQMVKDGRAPKPIRLSEGVSVWRVADIEALCHQIEQRAAEVSE